MQIPYETTARPDTGLYNAKLGIWLFLASEVMLFGGLFSAYIFLRMGSDDGYWPHGLLNVPVGAMNTIILIASSVTVVLAWASLKMRQWKQYKIYMAITVACAFIFLGVKLAYEWPQKLKHFGAFIKQDKWEQYEDYLGNHHLQKEGKSPRPEITGHLHAVEIDVTNADPALLDAEIKKRDLEILPPHQGGEHKDNEHAGKMLTVKVHTPRDAEMLARVPGLVTNPTEPNPRKWVRKEPGVKMVAFEVDMDQANANPKDKDNDSAHFLPRALSGKEVTIHAEDVATWGAFVPKHSAYFAVYFTITGLHGLHVLAGALVFVYFLFWGEELYRKNPEHMANRVEVSGLFWHFVDLVWIFVFPIFYLL